jgi:hypothetical protein
MSRSWQGSVVLSYTLYLISYRGSGTSNGGRSICKVRIGKMRATGNYELTDSCE